MPIGFTVGKQNRLDPKFDRYANLDVYQRLHREASRRGYSGHITVSHMTRGYCCEVRKMEAKFRNSTTDHIYYFTEGHKYGPNPLEATIRAFRQCIPSDPLMLVLYLEAEAVQLGMEYADRKALDKKLETALEDLRAVLDSIPISFWHGDQHIGTCNISELRSRPSVARHLDDDL